MASEIPWFFLLAPAAAILALVFAGSFYKQMLREDAGSPKMREVAGYVRRGAKAYLRQQYKTVALAFAAVVLVVGVLSYGFRLQNPWTPFAFISSGVFSALAGYCGMSAATQAASRVAQAVERSLNHGLKIAFRSGAVTGLVVVGFGLLDISVWFAVLSSVYPMDDGSGQGLVLVTTILLTFGMGASLQALFARVGGGIYTKAADVGADLVGKVECDIPEDDPRNPAVIADNVGDNVGDVAGMGADLYESYCGSILATAALGAAAFAGRGIEMQMSAALTPMLIGALGILCSIFGIFGVKIRSDASDRELLKSLSRGVYLSAGLIGVGACVLTYFLYRSIEGMSWMGFSGSIVVGLLSGILIGKLTEYATSAAYGPTRRIAETAEDGAAPLLIAGMGEGLISTAGTVLVVVSGICLAFASATGFQFDDLSVGLFGIGLAAVGMLSTLAITLASDAFGPIADNAGGNAEMGGLGAEARRRTDALDSLGNTTAATGKGFAIGSAAFTALALLAGYVEQLKIGISRIMTSRGEYTFPNGEVMSNAVIGANQNASFSNLSDISVGRFVELFEVHLLNPSVLVGLFVGAMMAFVFSGLTMKAVGRAASQMVEEVRRQFREDPGILEGTAAPNYNRCIEISTRSAQREMVAPTICAVAAPIVVGLVAGAPGVFGLLTGALATAFSMAVFMSNAGGAFDNAKKYIEAGAHGGKGSEAHHAAVVGDTVGDPFKDTTGPSLNILVKLMTMVAIVVAGLTVSFSLM